MTHIPPRRTQAEQDDLSRWLHTEAEERSGPQTDMLHRIADMIRARTPAEIAREAFTRAADANADYGRDAVFTD